ncbi:DUF2807 domain-containing protein [Sphingomonas sinipercae]|uniref:DUF2807 domain-containing protein n=1 Tax=Sphingomonas sinipercae TaxID=2714944 RepID=A0A6G7ZP70_9SPHN|nr:head GIN domain-containing protein [Sphingomonas sinipercae]QIL02733.1 DUF2807 domain-containing protein [Sphingomonas sinipercae]
MTHRHTLIFFAAAGLTSAALLLPTSGLLAQNWTTVTNDRYPIVTGSGRVVQQVRPVSAYQRVETAGSADVQIRFGPRPSLMIAADDNILPLLTTQVRNGTLHLGNRGSFRMRGPIRVWITTPSLDSFESSGSGQVTINGVNNRRLALTFNGSGGVQATGRTGNLSLDIHGSGRAALAGLVAQNAKVGLYGSGDATVRTPGTLDAQVFGSGTIRYVGRPSNLRQQRFGSGRIIPANRG